MTTQDLLREFVQLEKDRRAAEDALKGIKERLTAMQEPLQEYFLTQGIQSQHVDGLTVYMYTQARVRPKNGKDKVIEALRSIGHDELVRVEYHWTQLNSLVRNYQEDGADLPPELEAAIEVVDEVSIRTRRT